jgi:uncharacterized protein YeaO (DUF488 family)
MSKAKANIDLWLKEIAPSSSLRKWFGHKPQRWESFRRRYHQELKAKGELTRMIRGLEKKHGVVTLVYGAADDHHNNAVALSKFLRPTAR